MEHMAKQRGPQAHLHGIAFRQRSICIAYNNPETNNEPNGLRSGQRHRCLRGASQDPAMDLNFSPQEEAFRLEVRRFAQEKLRAPCKPRCAATSR